MRYFLTCTRGHQWEGPELGPGTADDTPAKCPVCGASPQEGSSPVEQSWSKLSLDALVKSLKHSAKDFLGSLSGTAPVPPPAPAPKPVDSGIGDFFMNSGVIVPGKAAKDAAQPAAQPAASPAAQPVAPPPAPVEPAPPDTASSRPESSIKDFFVDSGIILLPKAPKPASALVPNQPGQPAPNSVPSFPLPFADEDEPVASVPPDATTPLPVPPPSGGSGKAAPLPVRRDDPTDMEKSWSNVPLDTLMKGINLPDDFDDGRSS